MKQRILTGWTFSRVLYLAMGIIILIQSVMIRQWMGMVLGLYFAAMGIFAFGCAAGNCFSSAGRMPRTSKQETDGQDISFEEIKTKTAGNN